jgi:hypothetical protein
MQPSRSIVDLGIEFAARVQRAHDHFQRGLVLEFWMRIDRNAAAIVGHGDEAVRLHLDVDESGVARQRLVHGVVDHFGEEVMQRFLVGAADIHAGTASHRLEPLQHLDIARGIAGLRAYGRWISRMKRDRPCAPVLSRCRKGRRLCSLVFLLWPWLDRCTTRKTNQFADYATIRNGPWSRRRQWR